MDLRRIAAAVTYNFDPDEWYERERRALLHRHDTGALDGPGLEAALAELDRRYDEMLDRLDGSYQLPR